jgi:hypothetical protein
MSKKAPVSSKKGSSNEKSAKPDSKSYLPDIVNFSAEPDFKIIEWLRGSNALNSAITVISLPDTCPGQSPLPTGFFNFFFISF